MKNVTVALGLLGACVGAPAFASCPEPTTTQGVENTNGVYGVSATVEIKPVLWVANAGEDTVSKIATDTNTEVARYSTVHWYGGIGGNGSNFAFHGPWNKAAPSRSAVDTDGNAYVANRGFDGRYGEVMKILTTGCNDRNGNGVCDTAKDLNNDGKITPNEMYPVKDLNGNGIVEDDEIFDERVSWIRRVGNPNEVARALAIDKTGNIWVGMYETMKLYKISAATGLTLGSWYVGVRPYGAAVDSKGRLFTASLNGSSQVRLDTANPAIRTNYYVNNGYGIALGKDHNGKEWAAAAQLSGYGFQLIDPDTLASTFPIGNQGYVPYGISFDSTGNIVFSAAQNTATRGATKARTDGSIVWTRPAPAGCNAGDQRGAIVDANNDVWIVAFPMHKVCKYLADGTYSAQVPVGNLPYTYSDASGIGLQFSDPTGKVTFQSDAVGPDFSWGGLPICFTGSGDVTLSVSTANTEAGLGFANPANVALTSDGAGKLCGTVPAGQTGRFIAFTFTIKTGGQVVVQPSGDTCSIDLPQANQPPIAACKSSSVCANSECVANADVNNGSSDADGDAISLSSSPSGPYGLGQTTVLLSVNDGKATSTCQASVIVTDCTAPAVTCPADIVAECAAGGAASIDPGSANATDNCGALSATGPGAGSFALGTQTLNFSATDLGGNTGSCSQTITVQDTTAPSIICGGEVVAECTGDSSATVTPALATASDICQAVSVANPGADVYALGSVLVGHGAIDGSGNTAQCNSTVTVVDTTAPAITCPAEIVAECTANRSATVTPGAASASDICQAVGVSTQATASFPVGTSTLSYGATDGSGNTSSCTAAVTVVDTTAPTITVAANSVGELWSPNHKYHTVSLADCGIAINDTCDGALTLASAGAAITCVTSDELENSKGDGNTLNDIIIVDATTIQVRAERDGTGDGRVYKIGFSVKDTAGLVTDGVCSVSVPHDQGKKASAAIDSGVKYTVCK